MVNLTPEELRRRYELEQKLRTRVLNVNEADELRQILEREKQQADSSGDTGKALGILLLLGLLIALFKK